MSVGKTETEKKKKTKPEIKGREGVENKGKRKCPSLLTARFKPVILTSRKEIRPGGGYRGQQVGTKSGKEQLISNDRNFLLRAKICTKITKVNNGPLPGPYGEKRLFPVGVKIGARLNFAQFFGFVPFQLDFC